AELLRPATRHRQRIGILETEGAEQAYAAGRLQPAPDFANDFRWRFRVGSLHLIVPQRAGVIDVGVDFVCRERIEDDGGAETGAQLRAETGLPQPLLDQRREHILFAKRFCAYHVAAARAAE